MKKNFPRLLHTAKPGLAFLCGVLSFNGSASPLIIETEKIVMTGQRENQAEAQQQPTQQRNEKQIIKTRTIRFTGNRQQRP